MKGENLMQLLIRGESDKDFQHDADGRKMKCPRKVVDYVVTGMSSAIDEYPPRFCVMYRTVNKNEIHQVSTKLGLPLFRQLDEYAGLPELYEAQTNLARGRDRSAVDYLERRDAFKFPHCQGRCKSVPAGRSKTVPLDAGVYV